MSEQQYREAVLTIISRQRTETEEDSSELNTTARYRFTPEQTEIVYDELNENGEREGETRITVLRGDLVSIQKTGFTEATMIIEAGKTHAVHYDTMVGSMDMMLSALSVSTSFDAEGGHMKLRYVLDIGDSFSAENTIELQITMRQPTGAAHLEI